MEVAVYLFTGFLEAGKTKFISETLVDPNFNDGKRQYLVISCEEGEEELDPSDFGGNVNFASFEDESCLTSDRLNAMAKRANADIVIVEYNGMWKLDTFYNALPEDWAVYQEILIVDSTTINSYNTNMRQLVYDKLQSCEIVVFNRVKPEYDKNVLHKIVRGVSKRANICYEDMQGEIEFDTIADPLPYNLDESPINIKDVDFATFYRDMSDEFEKYRGKTVRFKGIVATDSSLPKGQYAIGRHIMTCCEADISYCGVVAKGMGNLNLKTRDWVIVEGKLDEEYSKLYQSRGPVLTVTNIERAEKPEQEVATFY